MVDLLYDAFRSHITFKVIKLFKDNKIAVVPLPSHTTKIVKPLEVSVFNDFKTSIRSALRKTIEELMTQGVSHENNLADVLYAIKYAYYAAFTKEIITNGFKKTVIQPLNTTTAVTDMGVRKSKYCEILVNQPELLSMINQAYSNKQQYIDSKPSVICGYVDTPYGIELTRDIVLQKIENL